MFETAFYSVVPQTLLENEQLQQQVAELQQQSNSEAIRQVDRIAELEKAVAVKDAIIASKTDDIQSILNAMAEAAANNSSNNSSITEPTIELLPRSEGGLLDPKFLDPFRK